VSLWPGLVLTERLLANTVETADGRRELHGLDISFGETPKFNGVAVVALAADPAILERTGRSYWTASLARVRLHRTTATSPEMANSVLASDGRRQRDYWRGVERRRPTSAMTGCPTSDHHPAGARP
jgi:hypothetical protein